LEEKGSNGTVKQVLLRTLKNSIGDCHLQRREADFKEALNDALLAMGGLSVRNVRHRNLEFQSPCRWVICFLGSLKGVRNCDGIMSDPDVNILIVCFTEETIDADQLLVLKELVSSTREGGLMVLRYRVANELGFEQQLDLALAQVKSAIKTYPCKRIPLIQEEIRF